MRLFFVLALSVSLPTWSFSQSQHNHQHEQGHHHGEASQSHGLNTNHGKKWQMDDHTRAMFKQMTQKVGTFSGDSKALGKLLQEDLQELIKGCTMKGAAHEELHKFLVLYMPAIGKLSESGHKEDLAKVKELLAMYPDYFE